MEDIRCACGTKVAEGDISRIEIKCHRCKENVALEAQGGLQGVATKLLEIRDRCTFQSVLALRPASDNCIEQYYFSREGFGRNTNDVGLVNLTVWEAEYDAYKWTGTSSRMRHAHLYIKENWDALKSGDVIDIEYILGESETQKTTERRR